MFDFKNAKIKTKLYILAASALIAMILIAAISLFNLFRIQASSVESYNVVTTPNSYLRDALNSYSTIRVIVRDFPIGILLVEYPYGDMTDDEYILDDIDTVLYHNAIVEDSLAKLVAYAQEYRDVIGQEERETITLLDAQYKKLKPLIMSINEIAKAKNMDALMKAILIDFDELNPTMRNSLNRLNEINKEKAIENQQAVTDIHNFAMLLTVIIVLLSVALLAMVSRFIIVSITKPIEQMVDAANDLAVGQLNINLPDYGDSEIGVLSKSFGVLTHEFKGLVADMTELVERHAGGDSDARIDLSKYSGEYKTMAQGLNSMVNSYTLLIADMLHCLKSFGEGDFKAELTEASKKNSAVNDAVQSLVVNLHGVYDEIEALAQHAANGNLDIKADASRYMGDWGTLLEELNALVKGIAEQAFWYESILDAIPLALSITDENMNWTFVNKATEDFLGKTRKEIKGQHCSNWGANICNTENCGIKCIKRGIPRTTFHQSDMFFQVDVVTLKDTGGKDTGYVEIVFDVTKLESSIKKLNELVDNIKAVSAQVAHEARSISQSSGQLAESSSQQASAIQELNASIDMINEKTQMSAQSASSASELSRSAKQNALTGNEEMKMMLSSMEGIKDASNNISRIIKTIEDISFQTNLLALNAAVEAARAGEHGKGFAVVAEEVRSLAGRSSLAAKETNDLIMDAIERVNEGTKIAESTATALNAIVSDFDEVSKIVDEIAGASSEQSSSIQQISSGISQIANSTQSNSRISQETSSASQELVDHAQALEDLLGDV